MTSYAIFLVFYCFIPSLRLFYLYVLIVYDSDLFVLGASCLFLNNKEPPSFLSFFLCITFLYHVLLCSFRLLFFCLFHWQTGGFSNLPYQHSQARVSVGFLCSCGLLPIPPITTQTNWHNFITISFVIHVKKSLTLLVDCLMQPSVTSLSNSTRACNKNGFCLDSCLIF